MGKPVIYTTAQLLEMSQKAELDVVYERTQLQIKEMKNLHLVREQLVDRLVSSARVTMKDVLTIVRKGGAMVVTLRNLQTLPEHVARAIKRIKIRDTADGQVVEVELAHHLEYDALLGKYVGLFQDKQLHLHQHQHHGAQGNQEGAPAPAKLHDLPPDQVKAVRARLEKEVEALDVRDTEKPPKTKGKA